MPSVGLRDGSSEGRNLATFLSGIFAHSRFLATIRGRIMRLGLYSITYLGLWYRGKALPLPQMIKRAKEYGYDGIEIDGKRPHGSPLDWSTARCRELRALADGEGIDIFAVAANNDFSNPVPEVREAADLLRSRHDRHDVRPGCPDATRVPGLVGHHATSATGHV